MQMLDACESHHKKQFTEAKINKEYLISKMKKLHLEVKCWCTPGLHDL